MPGGHVLAGGEPLSRSSGPLDSLCSRVRRVPLPPEQEAVLGEPASPSGRTGTGTGTAGGASFLPGTRLRQTLVSAPASRRALPLELGLRLSSTGSHLTRSLPTSDVGIEIAVVSSRREQAGAAVWYALTLHAPTVSLC